MGMTEECEYCGRSANDTDFDYMPCCNANVCWDYCLNEYMDGSEFRCFACSARVTIANLGTGDPWVEVIASGLEVKVVKATSELVVPARARVGVWALHLEPQEDMYGGRRLWSVTHIPTGLAARRSVSRNKAEAAFELLTTHFRWWELNAPFANPDRFKDNETCQRIGKALSALAEGEIQLGDTPFPLNGGD